MKLKLPASLPDTTSRGRLFAALTLLAMLGVTVTGTGCGKAPATRKDEQKAGVKGDPWDGAAQQLRGVTDTVTIRAALAGLTNDLAAQDGPKPQGLTPPALDALAAVVPLSPQDREELAGAAFSPHDAVYLADCLYLRDVARALALSGFPPEVQARLAFEWVCRQVYLFPWVLPRDGRTLATTAVPPTAVLRRGYGSGLERMYVFLALLQQLGIDGCLIGSPGAGNSTAQFQVDKPLQTRDDLAAAAAAAPRGPFWAAGVRAGNDVLLFDPWRGVQMPFTLNQLKTPNPAKPDEWKVWFDDKSHGAGVKYEDAKQAQVYLAVPVNALTPRMAMFESKLKSELGVTVAIDAASLRGRFAGAQFWNPPADPLAYGRMSRTFLPLDAGGSDQGAAGTRLFDLYRFDQIPVTALGIPQGLHPQARPMLRNFAAGGLGVAFVEWPTPRERIQRGLYQDVIRELVAKLGEYTNGLERLRVNKDADEQIAVWLQALNEAYLSLEVADLRKDPVALGQAQTAIENQWKHPAARLMVDKLSAEVGQAESAYLLALCKHEQAEGAQRRLDLAKRLADAKKGSAEEVTKARDEARLAWETATAAWSTYQRYSEAHAGFPGRAAHARLLTARAETLVKAAASPPK